MTDLVCKIDGCGGSVKARGLCNRHYLREIRYGSATAGAGKRWTNDTERLWDQIDKTDQCWVWTGSISNGYGVTTWQKKGARVHRLVYTLLVGPIPDDMQLDHLCRNRACCKPDHLEPVTQQENIRRGARGGTNPLCPKGHPYDQWVQKPRGPERRCSVCERNRQKARYRGRSSEVAA